jgi:DHA3 family tetracycline resistance protein-like MFS transporter
VSRADPVRLYYGLTFVRAMPGWVVVDLLLVRVLELSPLQLILMGTAMEATVFLCEVPTGVVADTYSRRLSLIIGFVGMGIAVVGVGAASTAWVVIALWALWGLSYTFTSGAFQAWITDEVGVENVGSIFLRGTRVAFAGGLIGLGVSVAIGAVSLRAAVIFGGVIEIACGLVCIFLMPETGFRRQPRSARRRALRELSRTAASGFRFVRGQRLVLLLVATELFAGFGAEAFDRLPEAHVIRDVGVPGATNPLFWFAPIPAVAMVFGYFAIAPMIRRVDRGGTPSVARMLVLFTSATIATQLAFAFGVSFAFVMTMWLAAVLTRSLVSPLYDTWLNSQITDSSVRATVFSISGQANAIGQATGGPVVGGIGNAVGIPAALATGALTLLPAVGLYVRALRHGGAEPELDALPSAAQT